MSTLAKALLQIHCCVVLWGFTAILGRLITLNALSLVWWRMLLVSVPLLFLPQLWSGLARMPGRLIAVYAGIGLLVALHWLAFYGAIKLANASVAATCMALVPVAVAWLEPWCHARGLDRREVALGVAVIPGVLLVVGGTPSELRPGFWLGVLSAALAALFVTLNKRYIGQNDVLAVTGLEMGSGALLLTCVGPLLPVSESVFVVPGARDAVLLGGLAFACTLLPFALSLVALRHLSAFAAALALNLEPVYAILLAIFLLGEQRQLSAEFYLGVAIVLLITAAHPWLLRRATKARA